MSYPVFQVPAGDVLPIFFDTFAGATGASITMSGLAVTDIEVYKDGSATQRSSDAGFALLDTDGIDFDGITGIHGFSIDTGDNTDAGFYTVGAWFTVVVSAVTVDGQTVSFIAAMFRIMAAEGVAGVPDVNVTHLADTAQSPGDIFGDSSDALPSLPTLAAYLDTEIAAIKAKTDNLPTDPADESLIIAATDAIMTRLGAPAGASVSADIAAVKADTAAILIDTTEIGAAGAGLTALASAANLATLDDFVDTEVAAIKATTDKLDATLTLSSDGYIFTAAALQDAPSGGLTAAAVADAVWEEAISDHSGVAGSTAEALNAAGSAGDPWVTALPGAYSAGQAGYILGTNLNATVSSRASQTSVDDLPTNAELATALGTSDDAVLAVLGTPAGASLAADVAAVQADTNDLQTRVPAALVSGRMDASVGAMAANVMTAAAAAADLTTELQAGLATGSDLATVAGYLDTEIAAILATTTKLDSLLENSSDGWIYTVAALQQAPAGGSGLDAAGVRAAIGLASANLDAQLDALPTAAENATAVMGSTVEGTFDLTESARLWNAALAGKASGLATATATFRDLADGKDRIVATVDADGNRTAVTRDVT